MGFAMFLTLWRLRDHRHGAGWLFGAYCLLAGVERFAVEFFRAKDDRFVGPLSSAQAVAVAVGLLGIALLWLRRGDGRSAAAASVSGP
jgi:phosphatidylglycerol:prolipoprotein diacylglycerol transferase